MNPYLRWYNVCCSDFFSFFLCSRLIVANSPIKTMQGSIMLLSRVSKNRTNEMTIAGTMRRPQCCKRRKRDNRVRGRNVRIKNRISARAANLWSISFFFKEKKERKEEKRRRRNEQRSKGTVKIAKNHLRCVPLIDDRRLDNRLEIGNNLGSSTATSKSRSFPRKREHSKSPNICQVSLPPVSQCPR